MNAHVSIDPLGDERFEVVTTSERFNEIQPAWLALWQRADGLIFQNPEWVDAWWKTLPDAGEYRLRICLFWKGDQLLVVAPFAISRRRGIRMLEWAARSYCDYCDILADPACPAETLARLWQELSASRGFDLVFLNRLLPSASARKMFGASNALGIQLRPNRREEISCRTTRNWQSGAAWLAAQSKKIRQEYRRHHRILSETGEITLRVVCEEEAAVGLLSRFMELKRSNLAVSNRGSELFDAESRTLRLQVSALIRAGIMHFFVLECAGKPIAFSLNFVQRQSMMAYVTTYDPAFSRGSPGDVLIMEYIQWSIDHGLTTIDLLCGSERFKNKFTNEVVTLQSVSAAATLRGSLAEVLDGGLHKARRWLKRENS